MAASKRSLHGRLVLEFDDIGWVTYRYPQDRMILALGLLPAGLGFSAAFTPLPFMVASILSLVYKMISSQPTPR